MQKKLSKLLLYLQYDRFGLDHLKHLIKAFLEGEGLAG